MRGSQAERVNSARKSSTPNLFQLNPAGRRLPVSRKTSVRDLAKGWGSGWEKNSLDRKHYSVILHDRCPLNKICVFRSYIHILARFFVSLVLINEVVRFTEEGIAKMSHLSMQTP